MGALAYLNVSGGSADAFAKALLGYALLQALLLLRLARWIGEQPLAPSYWAFSFGGTALAAACIRLATMGSAVAQTVAAPVFVEANAGVAALAALTLFWLVFGRLLPPPGPPA